MRLFVLVYAVVLFAVDLSAQPRPTDAADYNGTHDYAVTETNAAFPFRFTVITEAFENGKLISSETYVNERQAAGHERITQTLVKNGKKSTNYQIKVGFGNVYCSSDGITWEGPQPYECPRSIRLYGREEVLNSEYSVEEKKRGPEMTKVYREYVIYRPANGKRNANNFRETHATIDSRGFFISVVTNEGTVDPKTIKLVRKQTWDFETKFKPIVAPK